MAHHWWFDAAQHGRFDVTHHGTALHLSDDRDKPAGVELINTLVKADHHRESSPRGPIESRTVAKSQRSLQHGNLHPLPPGPQGEDLPTQ